MLTASNRFALITFSTATVLLSAVGYAFKDQLTSHYGSLLSISASIVNFQIAGYYIPWRYISIGISLALLFVYYKIRKWMRARRSAVPHTSITSNGPVMVSGKTLLEMHSASQNVKDLSKRLDSVEKTTHLVMKQLEAMTKCLAEVLREEKIRGTNNNRHVTPETHL